VSGSKEILISEKSLKMAQGRFGKPAVLTTLEYLETWIRRGTPREAKPLLRVLHDTASRSQSKSDRRVAEVAEVLLQDSPDKDTEVTRLLTAINGVSELATVPLQTPKARVTPRDEGRDGDREKHQLS